MRVRAIIEGRYAWRDEGPGNGAAGTSGYHGSIVQGEPGAVARGRHQTNAHRQAKRLPPPLDRSMAWWRTAPPCGVLMPRINQVCARHIGHRPDHRSAARIEAALVKRNAA